MPKVIETLRGVGVIALAAGCDHSMVLTNEGTVFSFGRGKRGQLGHGDRKDQLKPKVIKALRGMRVVAIAAGTEHSLVLTDGGAVLSFGNGQHGRLGHGDTKDRLKPKVIDKLRGVRVTAIAAGRATVRVSNRMRTDRCSGKDNSKNMEPRRKPSRLISAPRRSGMTGSDRRACRRRTGA